MALKNNDKNKEKNILQANTGPMQFGDDWPGVFIRGDAALFYALQIGMLLEKVSDERKDKMGVFLVAAIESLQNELRSCFAISSIPEQTQLLKAYSETCIKDKVQAQAKPDKGKIK